MSTSLSDEAERVAEAWAKAYTSTYQQYSKVEPLTESEMFAELYNNIVHSAAIHTILNVEHSYNVALGQAVSKKEHEIADKTQAAMERLEKQKSDAENSSGSGLSDVEINNLYAREFEELEILESTLESELSLLRESQKNEFREWINTVSEDLHGHPSIPYSQTSASPANFSPSWSEPAMEESFTIYLGTQHKTMHNLRLIVMDPIDLCRSNLSEEGGTITRDPRRMQTALTLYSNNVSALITVVNNRVKENSDFRKDLGDICAKTCEFHFNELDQQLNNIQEQIIRQNRRRFPSIGADSEDTQAQKSYIQGNNLSAVGASNSQRQSPDEVSISSQASGVSVTVSGSGGGSSSSASFINQLSPQNQRKLKALTPGDVYITKHSNLAAIHVIFHLVGDSKIENFDMTSQHPMFTGLRNIFRFAIDNDVINIFIPVLLVTELSDDKTFDLCVKRAELVFKCVKGFMIEATTWTSSKSRTLQFMLPRKVSPLLFEQLCKTLQETFPISNPTITRKPSAPFSPT